MAFGASLKRCGLASGVINRIYVYVEGTLVSRVFKVLDILQ